MGGVNDKWSLRYVVGPRSIQMNTVIRKMGPLGPFLVASRKHRPHHSIHLYTPRPDYISQRPCRRIRKRTVCRTD